MRSADQAARPFMTNCGQERKAIRMAGNNLSAMSAIDAEVRISGKYEGIGKCFGHTHEAGIGEAHGNISVFLQQL